MLSINSVIKVTSIVFACFTATTASGNSSNLAFAGRGVLENVYSYLPLIERQLTFRSVRGVCNSIYLEHNNLDGTLELKGYLNEIHDQWDTWNAQTEQLKENFILKIHALHCRLSTEEQYALQSPRIFRRWKDAMLRDASVVRFSVVDQEEREDIVRRVFQAVRLRPFCDYHSVEGAAYRNVDLLTKELIHLSRQLNSELVTSSSPSWEMDGVYTRYHYAGDHGNGERLNHADLKWKTLWYQQLWDHISARNGSLLPPRNTVFQIQNEAQSQYLKHLVTDCGLGVIHPMYLNQFLDHKLYWKEMDRARAKWERNTRGGYLWCFPTEDIYGMFDQKYVIMAMRSMRYDGDGIGQFQRWRERNQEWLNRATQRMNIREEDDLAQQLSRELMYW